MMSSDLNGAVATPKRVLIVDDDDVVLRTAERVLSRSGFATLTAGSAEEATPHAPGVDLILCDDGLPGMRGLQFLEQLRAKGTSTPFILMTGAPTVANVVGAFEGGATSFLMKPFRAGEVLHRVQSAFEAFDADPVSEHRRDVAARFKLHESFERALEGLKVAFQPIAAVGKREVYGFEALMRSSEPDLPSPGHVLEAAERLQRLHDVGQRVRRLAAEAFDSAPPLALLFVNLHAYDLTDDELFDVTAPLARHANRVVLEITERADLRSLQDTSDRLARLRALGYRIAVDDLGAGYAGLTSLVELDPDVVKLDMALIRDIDRDQRRQRIVGSLIMMCNGLGRAVVAEGVERREELEVLMSLGVDLVQGYLLARPGPPFPEVRW